MTELIRQRFRDDCTVCCIAMATGLSYERALTAALMLDRGKLFGRACGYRPGNGTANVVAVLQALGFRVQSYHMGEMIPAAVARAALLWRRRAIVSVPTRTGWHGWHDIYWDGAHIFDPSDNPYPDDLDCIEPIEVLLFDDL